MVIALKNLTISKAHEHLKAGDFSARELAESYLENIKEKNGELNAYLEIFDDVREQADRADEAIAKGNAGVLTGIPLAIKDNILIHGHVATCASRLLEGYLATYDAGVIEKLKDAHAIFLGRTNMDEFAMGSSTEHSAFGPTKNPHDLSRIPGGSSGGSAAAVAADLALGALGSDTGGSVRQPAALCGVVGLKPTYGTVSRHGLVALASSLDQVSPFTKTVADAEILYDAIKGHDALDSTSAPLTLTDKKARNSHEKRIGIPYHLFTKGGIDEDTRVLFDKSLALLKDQGYTIRDITLPHLAYSLAVYYIIMSAEASSNLARFDGVRYGLRKDGGSVTGDYEATRGVGFGNEPRMRILLGAYVLSAGYHDAYYRRAIALRAAMRREIERAFEEVDFIALPTSPGPAWKLGERTEDPLSMYLSDVFTVPANITGIPALSLPMGTVLRGGENLPVGFQFMAPHFSEKILFQAGKDLEKMVK